MSIRDTCLTCHSATLSNVEPQAEPPRLELPSAREQHIVVAPSTGTLTRLDALALGVAAWRLGAAAPARRTPSHRAPGSSCTPSLATAASQDSLCRPRPPTPLTGSPPRAGQRKARSREMRSGAVRLPR